MLNGRQKIFTNYREITKDNIGIVLANAYREFLVNVADIDYLYAYYRGIQPILYRKKKVRPEINNKIVENHANSIVQFKTGYLLEKPIQYVARKDDVDNDSLISFNDYLEIESKETKDKDIANDQAICGTAYRLVLPNKNYQDGNDESPFNIFTIKPNQAFVVYSSDIGNKALMGVIVLKRATKNNTFEIILQAYTEDYYYVFNLTAGMLENVETNTKRTIPLIEYPYNEQRIGAFEVVINLLDAINVVQSNRIDGVEQFIQALLVFKNVEITKEMLEQLQELGAINIKDNGEITANISYLQQELNQTQVQKLKDDMLEVVYKICGMPNRNGSGGGDTGVATIMRDGWSEAEARTQEVELMFKGSEKQFLKIALSYTRTLTKGKNKLKLSDLEIKFTRRNYENIYQKAQVLDLMLKNDKIAPRLAFITCGLFQDPENAYQESIEYYEEAKTNDGSMEESKV